MTARPSRHDRLPLTYDECRARFRHVLADRGIPWVAHPITARGPDEQRLTIDVAHLGTTRPARALLVLSGVHGVEGFIGSALQCDLVGRLDPGALPANLAVVLVHAVNPWGMAWWRRQNEHNVDLNRNWRRDDVEPVHNDAYDEVHALACPDTPSMPELDQLLSFAAELVATRGVMWLRDALTAGQYRHPDGLHFGGDRTEESNRTLEHIVREHLSGVEPTVDNPDATTGRKSGQIANGIRHLLPDATCYATSLEIGTASDEEQIIATYQEQWVHRRGDRRDPAHAAAVWRYRCCFTPDDPEWERQALAIGAAQLDSALHAVSAWT